MTVESRVAGVGWPASASLGGRRYRAPVAGEIERAWPEPPSIRTQHLRGDRPHYPPYLHR